MAHPNEDLVREAFAAFGRGDIEALQRQYFAPDIRWHFPGRSPLAGHHEGVAQVAEKLGRPAELSGGTHRIELHDVIGNDNHVVVLATAHAERAGRHLEVNVVHAGPAWTRLREPAAGASDRAGRQGLIGGRRCASRVMHDPQAPATQGCNARSGMCAPRS